MSAEMPMFPCIDSTGHRAGRKTKRTTMFASLVRFIRDWKRYNRSVCELSSLGDRELADIGISRSDIHARRLDASAAALSSSLEIRRKRPRSPRAFSF